MLSVLIIVKVESSQKEDACFYPLSDERELAVESWKKPMLHI